MFLNFVEYFEKKVDGKIVDLRFRDKKKGWGAFLAVDYCTSAGAIRTRYFKPEEVCYYYYLYKGLFF